MPFPNPMSGEDRGDLRRSRAAHPLFSRWEPGELSSVSVNCGLRILQVKKHNLKFKTDEILKSPEFSFPVIPVKTGIQSFQEVLCPAFGGVDFRRRGNADFLREHQY
jgi:hypothetical protein